MDKDCLKTLEKSIDTEKAFSELKDKQIDETLQKIEKASSKAVDKFKASDEYLDKLCDYYVGGFELFLKELIFFLEILIYLFVYSFIHSSDVFNTNVIGTTHKRDMQTSMNQKKKVFNLTYNNKNVN